VIAAASPTVRAGLGALLSGNPAFTVLESAARPETLAELAETRGTEFDRLFLKDMIRHHEGALSMVAALLGTTGAGQEPEVFRFAAEVDTDQRAEIARMSALLDTLQSPAAAQKH